VEAGRQGKIIFKLSHYHNPVLASASTHDPSSSTWNVRESYLSLLTDIRDLAFAVAALRERRDELQGELYTIYRSAPHTDGKAYGQAQDSLQNREDLTFTDEELDAFLPGPLKRKK
jgi:hypothetical protein